jgi:hypothetical protein
MPEACVELAIKPRDIEPPSDYEVAKVVAERDWQVNSELRQSYPASREDPSAIDPEYVRPAAKTVLRAIKPLQNEYTEITAV